MTMPLGAAIEEIEPAKAIFYRQCGNASFLHMEGKSPGQIDAEKMAKSGPHNAAMGYDKNTFEFFCQQVVAPAADLIVESAYEITAGESKKILLLNPLLELG